MPASLIHPTLRDIAPKLPDPTLKAIAAQLREEFRADSDSCAPWRDMHAQWIEIYFQRDRTKKPFIGASEDSLPILAEACDQFHARASKAMFPNRGRKIFRCVPTGADDPIARERATRVEKHFKWQLIDSSSAYRQSKDAMLTALPLHGSVFTKAFIDPISGVRAVRNVRATDLILPYGAGPRVLEDVPRKTEVCWIPNHYARRLHAYGYFSKPVTPWSARSAGTVERNPADDVVDDIMGFQESWHDPASYGLLLEQHRWLDLDEDGIEEPYVVWLDAISGEVIRVQIRYETDEAGVPVAEKAAMEAYTQYDFVPNPDGIYGIGHGLKVGAINHALNRLLRTNLDAAMLANLGQNSGIINKSIGIKKGEIELKLGKFITTETPVEDVRSQILSFPFPGPVQAGIALMELLASRADRLSMVTEALTGQTEAVMQPTTVLALLEQSNIVFSAVYERLLISWESELAKIYRLNRMYMDEQELFAVYDTAQAPPEIRTFMEAVARTDYAEDFQIKVISDPDQLTLKEKLAKAEAAYGVLMQNPIIAMSPLHMRNALVRYLEALDIEDIDEIVPTPEQVMQLMAMQAAQQQAAAEAQAEGKASSK